MDRFKYYGIAFNNVKRGYDGLYWGRICESCLNKFPSDVRNWDTELTFTEDICDVIDCNNKAEHYINFLLIREVEIIKE